MTDRRDPQIREVITGLALASRPAPTFEEIVDTQPTTSPAPNRTWIVAIATAAAVLVIIGAASLLLGGSEGSAPPADTTTIAPDPAPTDPAASVFRDAGNAEDAGWTLVNTSPDPAIMRPGFLDGSWVILDPGYQCRDSNGFYTECDKWDPSVPLPDAVPEADPTEVLWTSTDGVNWRPVAISAFEGKALDRARGNWPHEWVTGGLLWATTTDQEVWATDDGTTWFEPEWLGNSTPRPIDLLWDSRASRSGDVIFINTGTRPFGWVSTDAGRSFAPVDAFTGEDTRVVAHWVSTGEFRAILTPTGADQGITLWRSTDATTWDRGGTVTGLHRPSLTLQGIFLGEPLVVLTSRGCGVELSRSFDGGLTWQPLDGISDFLSERSEPPYISQNGCTQWSAAMEGWILVQTGFEVAVSRDGLDWYFIDGAQLEDFPPSVNGGMYTDSEGNELPKWWMPPIQ